MTLLEQVDRRNIEAQAKAEKWQRQVEAIAETRHQENLREYRKARVWAVVMALIAAIIGGLISRQW